MNNSLATAAAAASAAASAAAAGLAQESHRARSEALQRPLLPHPQQQQRRPRSILRHPSSSSSGSSSPASSSGRTSNATNTNVSPHASRGGGGGRGRRHPSNRTLSFNPQISGRRIDCLIDLPLPPRPSLTFTSEVDTFHRSYAPSEQAEGARSDAIFANLQYIYREEPNYVELTT